MELELFKIHMGLPPLERARQFVDIVNQVACRAGLGVVVSALPLPIRDGGEFVYAANGAREDALQLLRDTLRALEEDLALRKAQRSSFPRGYA